jgi:hypothetical protein
MVAALALKDTVVSDTGIIPPFIRSQSYTGLVDDMDNEKRVIIDIFFVTPI